MIALEYAKALFELINSENAERIDNELQILCDAFNENPDAIKVLSAPNIAQKEKKNIVSSISHDMDELLQRFLLVLIDNDRIDTIYEIKKEFKSLISKERKKVEVSVISKKKLTNIQSENIKKALSPRFGDCEIIINNIVDNSLIGGFKCISNGELIDLTIRGKLNGLKQTL